MFFALFPLWRNMYHKIPIIAALTTGAQSHTKIEKAVIVSVTVITLAHAGRKPNKNVTNITQSVILKPLTAMKCVRPELLKSSFRS